MFTTIVKNKPVNSFINFEDLFDEMIHANGRAGNKSFMPAVNITDKKESYQIELAVPGFTKENFSLAVEKNLLTISGEKAVEEKKEEEKVTRKEFHYAAFKRSFTLPKNVVSESIAAKYENGILVIEIPKNEEAKEKAPISIQVA